LTKGVKADIIKAINMAPEKQTILPVGSVFEKYRIEGVLGKGGMGEVYLLRHQVLDSLFALKILFPEVAQKNQKFVDRFIREAKLAAKIQHPNLVAVYDTGRHSETGIYYIIMEYVAGGSVRELLKREEKLTEKRALEITAQIAEALVAAHANHMVHRDIKPDNIMFSADGVAKLADLGIAKSTGEKDTLLTVDISVFVTPAYMSPEQALDSRMVDSRSDIYSLGIVLYEMLTGNKPFTGKTSIEILAQVLRETEIQDVRTINPAVSVQTAELIACMVAKKMENRPSAPSELLARIRALLRQRPSSSSRRSTVAPLPSDRADAPDEADTHATDASWSCNAEANAEDYVPASGAQQGATALTVGVPPSKRKTLAPVKAETDEQEKRSSSGVKVWLILPLVALLAVGGYVAYTYYSDYQNSNTVSDLVVAVNKALDQKDLKTAAAKVVAMEVLDAPRALLYRKKFEMAEEQVKKEKETSERNATVERLRGEIEAALDRKDSAVASAKIAELEKSDVALAEACRKRLEEFARENDAKPAYVKARAAKESIDKRNLDARQGIGARLREMNEAFVELDMAWQARKWGEVVSGAGKVQSKCAELESLDSSRKEATTQKEGTDKVRQAAEQAEASKFAEQLFTEGEKASIRAGASFESGDFEVATKAWKEAATAYGAAAVYVKSAQAYGKAKESFEAGCKQYASVFEKYGGPKLKEAREKESLAVSLQNNPGQGKKAYEEAQSLLLVAIDEANARKAIDEANARKASEEEALIPKLKLVATVDGQDVKADAIFDKTYSTPVVLTLKDAATYNGALSFVNGARKYAAKVSFTVDWKGEKVRSIALEEVRMAQPEQNYVLMLFGNIPLDLIWIKPGTFIMGSPKEEIDRQDDEALHRVKLTKGFWIGKYEVTQGQWEALMGTNPSNFKNAGKSAPVEQISWDDATRFCEKMTQVEKEAGRLPDGYVYALPTEAQWEYACRAGTSTPLNSGKTPSTRDGSCPLVDEVGWYSENSQGAPRPVGGKKANAWGLFDMHGNVWEWCRDYCTHKGGVVTDTYIEGIADPLCKTGISRVCRGGGCISGPGSCWSANRSNEPPTSKNNFIGFRLALAPIQ
jgi:serine/threonine protein kinase/formylglycine-generating enzyme required for sulfatase activity